MCRVNGTHFNIHSLPVALPPDTERVTMVSADSRELGGMMLITTGTATSSVGEPSVASSPVPDTCPKLN